MGLLCEPLQRHRMTGFAGVVVPAGIDALRHISDVTRTRIGPGNHLDRWRFKSQLLALGKQSIDIALGQALDGAMAVPAIGSEMGVPERMVDRQDDIVQRLVMQARVLLAHKVDIAQELSLIHI